MLLENLNTQHMSVDNELYMLVFGRTLQPVNGVGETVYEIILSEPGTEELIKIISEKFKLDENPEILSHVS